MVERSKCMNVPEIRFKEFCDYYSDILLEKCLSVSNKKNNKLEYKKEDAYNPQIEMFARFKMKSSFHKTKRII